MNIPNTITAKYVEVMQAFLKGESIQVRCPSTGIWTSAERPIWDFNNYEYRVKPLEARTVWVNTYRGERHTCFADKDEAVSLARRPSALRVAVEFKEVLSD